MKKFVSVLLAVVAAVGLCFGVAGCKKEAKIELPEATAERPVYDLCEGSGYARNKSFSSQAEFLQYYYGDFKNTNQSKFYVLSPDEYDDILLTQEFALYSNISGGYRLQENLNLYDEELGSFKSDKTIGSYCKSLELAIVSVPQEQTVAVKKYAIEFGEQADKSGFKNYINIYSGEICIATCYFKAYVSIQKSWFEEFFTEKLWFADGLKENDFVGAVEIGSAKAAVPQTESIFNGSLKTQKVIYDYRKFNNFYNREFKDICNDKFFIFRPQLDGIELNWVANSRFAVLSKNQSVENISECFWLYDKDLGSPKDEFYDWSVFVNFVSKPVSSDISAETDIKLEFGSLENGILFDVDGFGGSFTKYFNLYAGETCIGTCYYYSLVEISEPWLADLIKQNIYLG